MRDTRAWGDLAFAGAFTLVPIYICATLCVHVFVVFSVYIAHLHMLVFVCTHTTHFDIL